MNIWDIYSYQPLWGSHWLLHRAWQDLFMAFRKCSYFTL